MMKIRFLTLKMGGRLIHEFDLYTSKYGIVGNVAIVSIVSSVVVSIGSIVSI